VENEEVGRELESNTTQKDATEKTETTNTQKEEMSPSSETEAEEKANPSTETGTELPPVELQPIQEEQMPQQYTSELVETDNFTLEIAHQITAGDMLVSTLLATNIVVLLLCRLLRDRK